MLTRNNLNLEVDQYVLIVRLLPPTRQSLGALNVYVLVNALFIVKRCIELLRIVFTVGTFSAQRKLTNQIKDFLFVETQGQRL